MIRGTVLNVSDLKVYLRMVPDDATIHAYDGEETGIVIRDAETQRELAFFSTEPAPGR